LLVWGFRLFRCVVHPMGRREFCKIFNCCRPSCSHVSRQRRIVACITIRPKRARRTLIPRTCLLAFLICYEFRTKGCPWRPLAANSGIMLFLEDSTLSPSVKRAAPRNGTRIPCAIPITLHSLDPAHPLSEQGEIILVNLCGCAARFTHAVRIGSTVELQGLPTNAKVTARIVNCISVSKRDNLWLLGLELYEP
jgi:hypothetical protein